MFVLHVYILLTVSLSNFQYCIATLLSLLNHVKVMDVHLDCIWVVERLDIVMGEQ